MITPDDTKIAELQKANETLRQANGRLIRDFIDIARALGADPTFDAVCQRVATLINLQRSSKGPA